MKLRKLVIESGIIAAAIAVTSVPTALSVNAAEIANSNTETVIEETQDANAESDSNESVKVEETDASEWSNKLLVVIDEKSSLNVREAGSTDSKIVGKMYRGSAADIIEKGSEWTKIKSGDIEGYVKNEFCVFGTDAEQKVNEICDMEAKVTATNVRLRSEATTESSILKVLNKGESLAAADEQDELDNGWVKVEFNGSDAYISAQYVEVGLGISEALSIEEVQKSQAATSAAVYSASQFRSMGVAKYNGYRWTWYSQRVLPGNGLKIPGRHVDGNGYVCDGDGYICLASGSLSKGTVVSTPFGKAGKVYDCGCAANTLDVYVNW